MNWILESSAVHRKLGDKDEFFLVDRNMRETRPSLERVVSRSRGEVGLNAVPFLFGRLSRECHFKHAVEPFFLVGDF